MIAVRSAPVEPCGTPEELLAVAERLFAERGVENVALTEVVVASGQKNRSALHYHFGSRDGVLTAVLNRRLESINARREAALDALPPSASLAAIVRATMMALVEVVEREPWGGDYIAILAQVMFHPRLLGRQAVNDALLPLLGVGEKLHPELDPMFLSNPDRSQQKILSGEELKRVWDEINGSLWSAFSKWTPSEWLQKHTSVSDADFVKEPHRNRFTILLGRTSHLAYHLGQANLVV